VTTPRWLVGFLGLGVAACAAEGSRPSLPTQASLYPPAVFAHRVSTTDVSVYWNCTRPESNALRVDGVVQNTGGGSVQYAEVEIVSVDTRDRTIASVRSTVRDAALQPNQISPFQLGLRTVGAEARIDLYYEYRVRSAVGMGGLQVSPQRFRARDICSETQHRVPKPQRP
jgi:hypothetical protein